MFYVNLCPFKKDIFHCNDQLHNFTQKQHEQWKMSFLRNFCLHMYFMDFSLKTNFPRQSWKSRMFSLVSFCQAAKVEVPSKKHKNRPKVQKQ